MKVFTSCGFGNPWRWIDALFNSQLRYVVPMFQRLYVWKENPQWTTLWEDVAEKADLRMKGTNSNAHYLGALIIEGVRSVKGEVSRFLVIDGQQRLTTLQIFLSAFRDLSRKSEWKRIDRACTRYLENPDADVMENPEEELFKIWPTKLNRDVFRSIVMAGSREAVENKFPIRRLPRRRKLEPRSNLVEAYLYFSRKIEGWVTASATSFAKTAEECAFALLQALQHDFCVVEIALSEGDDSQEIFYSLNSQGQPLSQSDLLRSLVFMRAEKEKLDRDAIFDDYWSKLESDFWSVEVRRGGRTYSRLDLGLRFFLMAKTGMLVDARRVNEEYRQWIAVKPAPYASVRDELADFARYGDLYKFYEESGEGLQSSDIRRIVKDFDVSTVLPLLLYLELDAGLSGEQLSKCLGAVESFIARRVFVGEETKEYNKLFVDVIAAMRGVAGEEVEAALKETLLSGGGTTRHWPTDDELVEAAVSREVFRTLRTPALRVILERLEVALRGKKSEDHIISDGLQIEHVLPRQWSTHWLLLGKEIPDNVVTFPYLVEDEFEPLEDAIRARNSRLHTLGNLSLLNQYLNPAASNGSFALKRKEYAHSVLRLNRYFDRLTEWDEDAINSRGKTLGQLMCKLWPRPA